MAGDVRTILDAVRDRMDALGFKPANAVFDFDAVPDSLMDRAYRIEPRIVENNYILGGKATVQAVLDVYVAYKLTRKDADAIDAALDDRETIESDVVSDAAIAALCILRMDGDTMTVKYLENYMVSKVGLRCDFIRTL